MNNKLIDMRANGIITSKSYKANSGILKGWCIAVCKQKNGSVTTLAGFMSDITNGETIKAEGKWYFKETGNEIFQVHQYSRFPPTDKETLIPYLSDICNINTQTSRLIVDKFGNDTIKVLCNSPEKLKSLQLNCDTESLIIKSWNKHNESSEIDMAVDSLQISKEAVKSLKAVLPTDVKLYECIKNDPMIFYRKNILTFEDSLNILNFLKGSKSSVPYLKSCMLYALREAWRIGDTGLKIENLRSWFIHLGLDSVDLLNNKIESLDKIIDKNIIYDNDRFYLMENIELIRDTKFLYLNHGGISNIESLFNIDFDISDSFLNDINNILDAIISGSGIHTVNLLGEYEGIEFIKSLNRTMLGLGKGIAILHPINVHIPKELKGFCISYNHIFDNEFSSINSSNSLDDKITILINPFELNLQQLNNLLQGTKKSPLISFNTHNNVNPQTSWMMYGCDILKGPLISQGFNWKAQNNPNKSPCFLDIGSSSPEYLSNKIAENMASNCIGVDINTYSLSNTNQRVRILSTINRPYVSKSVVSSTDINYKRIWILGSERDMELFESSGCYYEMTSILKRIEFEEKSPN